MKCSFCDREAVERGGEHIWDDWLNRRIPRTKHEFKYASTSGIFREYTRHNIDEKLPLVCEKCNSGWMSQITNRICQTFGDAIVGGAALSVLPIGIELLTSFIFLKAVLGAQLISEKDEAFFTRAERERLRKSLAIPSNGINMWVGAFKGNALHSGRFAPGILTSTAPQLSGIEYFTFTYVIGRLVLQLLAARWKNVRHRGIGYVPMLIPDPYWNAAAVRIWPSDGSPITWPPPKYFNDAGLKQFINRFKLPITNLSRTFEV